LTLLATASQAADSGFYVGAGTGQATVEVASGGQTSNENSTPYRAFAGYRLGAIPILDFAGEIGYRDLGTAEGTVGGSTVSYQSTGADAAALVIFPILGFDLFGKFGVFQYNLDKTVNGTTTGYSGTAPMYGAGVGFRFWRLGIRAEYEYLDVDEANKQQVGMVSLYFRF
jgi:hypothetical protein